jgi:rare lipoprotein A
VIAAAVGVQTLPQPLQAQSREKSGIVVADASQGDWAETGTASWYGPGFAGRRTASGETYDPQNLTAAHRSLPLGSLVRVHNLDNDRHMVVRINDRGPFVKNRVIDVSQAAAEVLGFRSDGVTKVRITPVAPPPTATPAAVERTAPPAPAPSGDAPATADPSPDPNSSAAAAPAEEAPAFLTESTLRQHDGDSAPSTSSQYFIQLGAFRENRHAQELLQSAGTLGLALSVEAADGMYRVVAGPFESSAAAQEAADEIQRAGLTAFVRRGH